MLKTPFILLLGTGFFLAVLCADDDNYGYLSSCEETQYEDYIICGPNEEYSACVNGGCDRRECVDLRKPQLCIDPAEGYCVEGCVCTKGYLRNKEGDCVPINLCPEKKKRLTTTTPKTTATTPKTTTTTSMPSNKNSSQSLLDQIWYANTRFTSKFIQLKINDSPQESFIASPFSVFFPLGQIAPFAKGMTSEELLFFFKLNDRSEVPGVFRSLLNDLNSPKNVTLLLGQKAYANKQYELNPKFIDISNSYFDSDPQNLDFSQNQKAADIINNWVKNQTNGLIPTLIEASMLNALSRLVLVNAIYFKGNWLRPFDPKSTQKKDFYVTMNKTVTVNMMYQEGTFGYTENSQYKALQLFYKDKDFSLLTILPTSMDDYSVKSLVNVLDDPNAITKIINNLKYERVRVFLPSIQTSTKTDLKNILQQYNVTEVFNPQKADISGLLKQPQQVYISEFIQKAVIIINEVGSEAAAANAGIVGITAVIQSKIFEANRPYMYFILYRNNVLFCGDYTGTCRRQVSCTYFSAKNI